jgi:hypothetical protein
MQDGRRAVLVQAEGQQQARNEETEETMTDHEHDGFLSAKEAEREPTPQRGKRTVAHKLGQFYELTKGEKPSDYGHLNPNYKAVRLALEISFALAHELLEDDGG